MIACFSDDYVLSQNSGLEFRFAHISLRLPIFKVIVGTGNEWRKNELAFLAGNYPEFNFQFKNEESYNLLLDHVNTALDEIKKTEKSKEADDEVDEVSVDNNSSAFQELYELTQRKFLGQLIKICKESGSSTTKRAYPRLFCIDLIEKHKLVALEKIRKKNNEKLKESNKTDELNKINSEEDQNDEKDNQNESKEVTVKEDNVTEKVSEISKKSVNLGNKFKMARLKISVNKF